MKKFKIWKKKLLTSVLSLLVLSTGLCIPVHAQASSTYSYTDLFNGTVKTLRPGDKITWTSDELEALDKADGTNMISLNPTKIYFDLMTPSSSYIHFDTMREAGYSSGEYLVPSTYPTGGSKSILGTVSDEWNLTLNGDNIGIRFQHSGCEVSFKSYEGTGVMDSLYCVENTLITMPKSTFVAPPGKSFKVWSIGALGAVGVNAFISTNTTFIARYADNYDVKVNGGTGTEKYIKDDTVSITANAPATGKQFKEWSVVSGGVTLANSKSETTTFTMPDNDVEVTATYEDIPVVKYDVKVNGGTGTETYAKGDTVSITANAPETGKQFKEWSVVSGGVTLANSKSETTTFTMPDKDVEVTATYEDITPPKPGISAGAGSSHQISDGKDVTFTCSGKLEDLTGIYVDGKLVADSNYTLKSGSTILTLKSSYLDTLSAGKHTLKFQYKDNVSAETDFTITAKASETPVKPSSPQTGDTSNSMLYFSLIVLSGCVAGFGLKKKKQVNK